MKNIFFVLALIFMPAAVFAQVRERTGVDVTGTASEILTPDQVIIQILVENQGKSAKEAQEKTTQSVSRVLGYLKSKNNIKSVETNYVSLRPQRVDYNKETYEYIATQTIAFILQDIGDYQNTIIDLLDRGVNGIGQVQFESSQREKHEKQLLARAIQDAREKAMFLATQIGQELGRAVYISDRTQSGGPIPYFKSTIHDEALSVIAPGELKVSVEVNVTFELK